MESVPTKVSEDSSNTGCHYCCNDICPVCREPIEKKWLDVYAESQQRHVESAKKWGLVLIGSMCLLSAIPLYCELANAFPTWVREQRFFGRELFLFPFLSPLLFLSFLASKNANLYRRLAEEYRHKQNYAASHPEVRAEIEVALPTELREESLKNLISQRAAILEDNPCRAFGDITSDVPMRELVKLIEKSGGGTSELVNILGKIRVNENTNGTSHPYGSKFVLPFSGGFFANIVKYGFYFILIAAIADSLDMESIGIFFEALGKAITQAQAG